MAPLRALLSCVMLLSLVVAAVSVAPSNDPGLHGTADGSMFSAMLAAAQQRVCLVYTARSDQPVQGPQWESTLYVRKALDVDDVSATVTLHHGMLGAVQIALVANSSMAASPVVVMLKPLGPGGLMSDLVNTTFTDQAAEDLSQDQASQHWAHTMRQPFEPLQPLADRHSPYAGLGGSVGTWSLVIRDTWPQSNTSTAYLHSWQLRLCGRRLPAVDAAAAGALPPNAPNNQTINQQQSAQGQSFNADATPSWRTRYKSEVLDRLDELLQRFQNSSALGERLQDRVVVRILHFKQQLAALPAALGLQDDSEAEDQSRFRKLLDTFKLCYNDLYLCYQKFGQFNVSFPVAQIDLEVSRRYLSRVKDQQQRLTNIEIQIKDAVQGLADRFPNLAARVGVEQGELAGLLSNSLTADLYGAAFSSASIAYFAAYLDAALGFLLYLQRFQLALNPRAAVYRTLAILQGVLGTLFYGLTYVPLFPSLVNPGSNIPILVNTAVGSAQAFRSAVDLLDEAMQGNVAALLYRRDYVMDNLAQSIKTTSDAFEQELTKSAPELANLYGSLTTTVEGFANTADVLRTQAQEVLKNRQPLQAQLRQQVRQAVGTMSAIALDLINSTSGTMQQARTLLDNLIPGRDPAQVINEARQRIGNNMQRAQRDLQQLIPLSDIQQFIGIFNSSVDGLLGQLSQAATQFQNEVPGPGFYQAMDAIQKRLTLAGSQVDGVMTAFESNFPGLFLNATLNVLNARTQYVVDDVNKMVRQAQQTFPNLDPQVLFSQLNATVDTWMSQVADPITSLAKLLPPDQATNLTQQFIHQVSPLVDSMGRVMGKAAKDLTNLVTPNANMWSEPMKDSIKGLNDIVNSLNDMLFNLNPENGKPSLNVPLPTPDSKTKPGNDSQPTLQLLSDQVTGALDMIANQAPLSAGLLQQINKSLKSIQTSIQSQQNRAVGQPGSLMEAAVDILLKQINATTQPWQEAVRSLDGVAHQLTSVFSVPLQTREQVISMRQELVNRMSDFNTRTSSFALTWANKTANRASQDLAQTFMSAGQLLDQGQQAVGQLADRLSAGADRLSLRMRLTLPLNTTIKVVQRQVARLMGLPLDQLQSALYKSSREYAAAQPGVIGRVTSTITNITILALDSVQARMTPVLGQLQDSPPMNGQALLLFANRSSTALQQAIGDWRGMFDASNDSMVKQLQSPLLHTWQNLVNTTQQALAGRLNELGSVLDAPAVVPDNHTLAVVQGANTAAQHLLAVQGGLRQASASLPQLSLPALAAAAQQAFAQQLQSLWDGFAGSTLGGLLVPPPGQLSPILEGLKHVLDDYLNTRIQTPADLVTFAGQQLMDMAAAARSAAAASGGAAAAAGQRDGAAAASSRLMRFLMTAG